MHPPLVGADLRDIAGRGHVGRRRFARRRSVELAKMIGMTIHVYESPTLPTWSEMDDKLYESINHGRSGTWRRARDYRALRRASLPMREPAGRACGLPELPL